MSSTAVNPYDEVPFPSQPLPPSQPGRLAAIGAMLGMQPAPANRCRVLELGCATGGNLLPLAERHPQSQFVGIDYSQVQIDAARRIARAAGLANLELRCASIAEVGQESATFDYVICHGVYSWVPHEVQDKILALCRSSLKPQGIAYVSYNTFPAWHLRLVIRQALRLAARGAPREQRVARGQALLEWLSAAFAGNQTPYARLLKIEIEEILRRPGEYLCHEYFESDNRPLYFHEFARRVAAANLNYLGDAVPPVMFAANRSPATEERWRQISDNPTSVDQHLDVLSNRGFRRSLLCHREISPARRLLPESLAGLYFAGNIVPQNTTVDLKSWSPAAFTAANGQVITHSAPPVKALLFLFGAEWPRSLSIDELTQAVAALIGELADASRAMGDTVTLNVAQFVASGLIEANSAPDDFTTRVSPRPIVSRLARLQAKGSQNVTNRRHETVGLDENSRRVIELLDGGRDHDDVVGELLHAAQRGEIHIPPGEIGSPASDPAGMLAGALRQWLTQLASAALLVD